VVASAFTMVFIFIFLYPVYKISTRKSALISTYSTLSFSKLDQDVTLKRSFFNFRNSYLMLREKPQTNYEKPLKMGS